MSESSEQVVSEAVANCAREPIRVPGGIQPHGCLICIDDRGVVVQVAANVQTFTGKAATQLLGTPVARILGQAAADAVLETARSTPIEATPTFVQMIEDPRAAGGSKIFSPLAIVLHRLGSVLIVELDPAKGEGDFFSAVYSFVRAFIAGVRNVDAVTELSDLAAKEIQRITGFGRTLVYRFDEGGHGHVLAEACLPGYHSYLGQRFPASDIPAQARELYKTNRIRLIPNANYTPAALVPQKHPHTGAATDLTHASLRSVSPVHLQYMQNMETLASMSMSIIVKDKLWGLISCHHATPRYPPFEVRTACEHIAQVLSLQIEAKEIHAESAYRLDLRMILASLLAKMAETENFVDALAHASAELINITAAAGAAVVFEGSITRVGITPSKPAISRLVEWLDSQSEELVATDAAKSLCPSIDLGDCAGFMAVSISKVYRNYVIWFRSEVIRTIEWAGDPRDKLAPRAGSLSPRESFDTWTDIVRDRSDKWRQAEQEIALEFRTALLGIILRRAEQLARLVLDLGRANTELEKFSYSVSHDLRAPLRQIASFADLLKEVEGDRLSERGQNYLKRIAASATFGGKLVDDLLSFAQMGRSALRAQPINMKALVESTIRNDLAVGRDATVDWRIGELGTVQADIVFIQLALRNLLENAVKFSRTQARPVVEIGCSEGKDELYGQLIYYVKDNGVGFDMRYVDKLFGVFQRLHRFEDFEGTGIGLANVHRIVERHGGKVWAEGTLGEGATFYFSLPREFRQEAGARHETPAAAVARLAATGNLASLASDQKT